MNCPKCEGPMWDNRAKKRNPKAPDFRCKDENCDGVIWPPKGEETESAPKRTWRRTDTGWQAAGNGLDERQRAIIRQHSQSMALEVLKLKQALNELTIVDLTPAKLRMLADYFDDDVIGPRKPHKPVEITEPILDEDEIDEVPPF